MNIRDLVQGCTFDDFLFRPQFSIAVTSGSVLRAVGAALLMGLVAAVVPARQVATAEPAFVYREH